MPTCSGRQCWPAASSCIQKLESTDYCPIAIVLAATNVSHLIEAHILELHHINKWSFHSWYASWDVRYTCLGLTSWHDQPDTHTQTHTHTHTDTHGQTHKHTNTHTHTHTRTRTHTHTHTHRLGNTPTACADPCFFTCCGNWQTPIIAALILVQLCTC